MKISLKYSLICVIYILLNIKYNIIFSQTEVTQSVSAPSWVSKRPVNISKYIGVGVADKTSGNNYQSEAKKNALFDLSSEIKVDISTNSILFTVQNNNQFNENFNSLIKLTNTDNIEGYRLVDTYENDKQYWLYYELDKQEYEDLKQKKKQLLIDKAVNLINLSFNDEKDGNFTASLKKRIQAFGILSPYLNEEVKLEASNNVKTIFDLSNTIQKQLQTITITNSKTTLILKPYQPTYKPLVYKLTLKTKNVLTDFPFIIKSDNEKVRIVESSSSNAFGDIEINIKTVKPLNREVYFTLNPDIDKLMGGDSVSKSAIILLKQFIETSQLKAYATVNPISVFISCIEKNNGTVINQKIIEPIIESKFTGEEVKIVEMKEQSDFMIEVQADTQKDISSDVLNKNYGVWLFGLRITLSLRNTVTKEQIYKADISEIYGYANTQETAGFNAYYSDKLKTKMSEALFFLKRKFIVY